LENSAAVEAWWGRPDWSNLSSATVQSIKDTVKERFEKELGYKYVHPRSVAGAGSLSK